MGERQALVREHGTAPRRSGPALLAGESTNAPEPTVALPREAKRRSFASCLASERQKGRGIKRALRQLRQVERREVRRALAQLRG